jgi:hypothetical protein
MVVYESMFGNTREIAEAIADGLSPGVEVQTVAVDAAPPEIADDIDIVVVGGPTHAFGMSRPGTRAQAASKGAQMSTSVTVGIREWLDRLQCNAGHTRMAAFDTRVRRPRVPGSAARKIAKRLRRLGMPLAHPTTFWVTGTTGPLLDGETERARDWGRELAGACSTEPDRTTLGSKERGA